MDGDMRQGWEHVVGCGGMWQGVGTCGIGGGRVWGHVEGVWISQLHECSSYVQTAMCKLVVQTGRANSMCKLVVQTLCANWSCKLVVQLSTSTCGELHERSWRAARALLCANCYVQTGCANCYVQTGRANSMCKLYVQTGRANSMCKLVVQTLCANWSCKLYVQTGRAALYKCLWRDARALVESCTSAAMCKLLCANWSCKLLCANCSCKLYVQTGSANSMCKLVVQTLCANWSCKLYVQTGRANSMSKLVVQITPSARETAQALDISGCGGMWQGVGACGRGSGIVHGRRHAGTDPFLILPPGGAKGS